MSNEVQEEFDPFALTPELQKHLWDKHIGEHDPRKTVRYSEEDVERLTLEARKAALEDAVQTVMSLVEYPPAHLPDLSLNDAWDLGLMTAAATLRGFIPKPTRVELVIRGEVVNHPDHALLSTLGLEPSHIGSSTDEVFTKEPPKETVVAELKVRHVLSGFGPNGLVEEINIDHLADKLDQLQVYFGPDDDKNGSYPLTDVGEMILKEKYGIMLDPDLDWFLESYTSDEEPGDDNQDEDDYGGFEVEYDCTTCPFCMCVCKTPKREPLSFCEAVSEFFRDLWRVFFGP